ncbi:hypothetical protein [Cedecea colo]|uniref:Uncharacterized protein n=1 Tax=Cedecea colo TaxID=2552946 RepID=A0ABX0VS38_9ENTR|nr:hypothetical protein [Cedecea colo]
MHKWLLAHRHFAVVALASAIMTLPPQAWFLNAGVRKMSSHAGQRPSLWSVAGQIWKPAIGPAWRL